VFLLPVDRVWSRDHLWRLSHTVLLGRPTVNRCALPRLRREALPLSVLHDLDNAMYWRNLLREF